tara:strand:- start:380 stop:868 length:489 start_codon:yes stop_codon:yes gene_type:complete
MADTATRRPFQLGTVSHGTLRPQDLLPKFLETLTALGGDIPTDLECAAHIEYLNWPSPDTTACDEDDPFWVSEDAGWDMEALRDALQNCCPPFIYFGAHEGDGSDFGFWPDMDALETATSGEPLNQFILDEEIYLAGESISIHVSGHNVTVYDNDGELWSYA